MREQFAGVLLAMYPGSFLKQSKEDQDKLMRNALDAAKRFEAICDEIQEKERAERLAAEQGKPQSRPPVTGA